jgi:hypothetical protein
MISSGVLSPYLLVMSGCLWFNKKKKQKFWGNCRSKLFQLEIYGIPYMKMSRNSVKFRGISRNYMSRNSGEFRRNFSQFRTEYGIDGSKKNRQNSVSTEFRGHPNYVPVLGHNVYSTSQYFSPNAKD